MKDLNKEYNQLAKEEAKAETTLAQEKRAEQDENHEDLSEFSREHYEAIFPSAGDWSRWE